MPTGNCSAEKSSFGPPQRSSSGQSLGQILSTNHILHLILALRRGLLIWRWSCYFLLLWSPRGSEFSWLDCFWQFLAFSANHLCVGACSCVAWHFPSPSSHCHCSRLQRRAFAQDWPIFSLGSAHVK